MTSFNIISEKPVTMAEVKDELSKIQKKVGELNFRSNKTHAYLQEFSKISRKKTKELFDEILKLEVPRLKEEHIVKIVDTIPRSSEEVKSLLSGYTITITNENAKKIADKVCEY
jgi:DNA-directed RNA polymerase subunit F